MSIISYYKFHNTDEMDKIIVKRETLNKAEFWKKEYQRLLDVYGTMQEQYEKIYNAYKKLYKEVNKS
jgi:hypothetical protein